MAFQLFPTGYSTMGFLGKRASHMALDLRGAYALVGLLLGFRLTVPMSGTGMKRFLND